MARFVGSNAWYTIGCVLMILAFAAILSVGLWL
jgi:hypothetical protein